MGFKKQRPDTNTNQSYHQPRSIKTMLPTYEGDDQQLVESDVFSIDGEYNLNVLFNDDSGLDSHLDDHRYRDLPPHLNHLHTDSIFQSSESETSNQLLIPGGNLVEETHPTSSTFSPSPQTWPQTEHRLYQDAANLNTAAMQSTFYTVDNPSTTLHFLPPPTSTSTVTSSQLPQANHPGGTDGQHHDTDRHPKTGQTTVPSRNAGEGSEARGSFQSPPGDHRQALPSVYDTTFDPSNIGNYLTGYSPPVKSTDGVSTFPQGFNHDTKPLGEPLPVNKNRGAPKKSRFLFHPYSHQRADHEVSAALCTS